MNFISSLRNKTTALVTADFGMPQNATRSTMMRRPPDKVRVGARRVMLLRGA